jgi:ribonucleoside-diphosphate reductase alpha chain
MLASGTSTTPDSVVLARVAAAARAPTAADATSQPEAASSGPSEGDGAKAKLADIAANGTANGHMNGHSNGSSSTLGTGAMTLNLGGVKVALAAQADAPSCMDCGSIMVRNGSCYKCLNCGSTSGCS